ncbi:DUF5666 domain-containing protein [Sphaerisporangium corydalis]|uniref:DUF5666 domain-containing protein n=1 Tax=Sphaerisporangium corydalis TaxID=1441875 RepID=A0ABV9EQ21_9ACTN|nr:DUF5666 domain-containing protein [Sphaerisporangium corydalis]
MRNLSKAVIGSALAGTLAAGVLGGVAVGRQSQSGGVPYELLSADSAADEAVSLTQAPKDNPKLRIGIRRGLIGIHGDTTVRARGDFATYTWQRGAVTAASATSLTVKSADGVSWTWTVTSDTKVRKNGAKSTSSAVATGDTVFVLGQPSGDARKAQGVVVPKRTKE